MVKNKFRFALIDLAIKINYFTIIQMISNRYLKIEDIFIFI